MIHEGNNRLEIIMRIFEEPPREWPDLDTRWGAYRRLWDYGSIFLTETNNIFLKDAEVVLRYIHRTWPANMRMHRKIALFTNGFAKCHKLTTTQSLQLQEQLTEAEEALR